MGGANGMAEGIFNRIIMGPVMDIEGTGLFVLNHKKNLWDPEE